LYNLQAFLGIDHFVKNHLVEIQKVDRKLPMGLLTKWPPVTFLVFFYSFKQLEDQETCNQLNLAWIEKLAIKFF
jgi:hypothetical protein